MAWEYLAPKTQTFCYGVNSAAPLTVSDKRVKFITQNKSLKHSEMLHLNLGYPSPTAMHSIWAEPAETK